MFYPLFEKVGYSSEYHLILFKIQRLLSIFIDQARRQTPSLSSAELKLEYQDLLEGFLQRDFSISELEFAREYISSVQHIVLGKSAERTGPCRILLSDQEVFELYEHYPCLRPSKTIE